MDAHHVSLRQITEGKVRGKGLEVVSVNESEESEEVGWEIVVRDSLIFLSAQSVTKGERDVAWSGVGCFLTADGEHPDRCLNPASVKRRCTRQPASAGMSMHVRIFLICQALVDCFFMKEHTQPSVMMHTEMAYQAVEFIDMFCIPWDSLSLECTERCQL